MLLKPILLNETAKLIIPRRGSNAQSDKKEEVKEEEEEEEEEEKQVFSLG